MFLRCVKAVLMDSKSDRVAGSGDGTQAFKRHLKLEQQQCATASIRNLNENYRSMLLKQLIVARETPNLAPSITKGASNPLESVYASGVIV